jgi:phage shock protein E
MPLIALLLLLASVLGAAEMTHTSDALETVQQAVAEGKALLVDVREQGEWDNGHLKAAQLLPLSRLGGDGFVVPATIPKDRPVYLHCRSGARCLKAAEILKPLGYDVRPLKAGYPELLKQGFEKAP